MLPDNFLPVTLILASIVSPALAPAFLVTYLLSAIPQAEAVSLTKSWCAIEVYNTTYAILCCLILICIWKYTNKIVVPAFSCLSMIIQSIPLLVVFIVVAFARWFRT